MNTVAYGAQIFPDISPGNLSSLDIFLNLTKKNSFVMMNYPSHAKKETGLVTIKEIAAEAGVSRMTVSNVINNVRGKVSPETEKRIRKIMEKYHYVPSMAARSLSSKSTHIIGILLPLWYDSPSSLLLSPYGGFLVGYFEELLRARDYFVMLCSFSSVEDVLRFQRVWHTDGMIQLFPHTDSINRQLALETECPLVVMDRHFDDVPMLSVCIEDRKGGYLATRHVLEAGHREIGFAGSAIQTSTVVQDRYQGYLDALSEYNIHPNSAWTFDGVYRLEGGVQTANQLIQMHNRPTAMITSEDLIACGIIQGYQENGLSVPKDISVVGFDNSIPSTVVTPKLTTINQFMRKKAECAVEMLLHAMDESNYRNDLRVFDVDLVQRNSVRRVDKS